jgi:hypothetical protein
MIFMVVCSVILEKTEQLPTSAQKVISVDFVLVSPLVNCIAVEFMGESIGRWNIRRDLSWYYSVLEFHSRRLADHTAPLKKLDIPLFQRLGSLIIGWLMQRREPRSITAHWRAKDVRQRSHPSYTTLNNKELYDKHQLLVRDFQQHRESAQRLADLRSNLAK